MLNLVDTINNRLKMDDGLTRMNGWIDGWIDGCMDEWTEEMDEWILD